MLPYHVLYLNSQAIMHGEIWRLFTFLLIPKSTNFLFLIFELSILVMCADGLEAEWGSFKLTIYYLFGAVANILFAFFIPEIQLGSYFIYLSLFLGFATIYPDYEILLFLILPIKVKYLAMFSGFWIFFNLAVSPLYMKIATLLSVANYLIFFGPDLLKTMKGNYHNHKRRSEFKSKFQQPEGARHTCSICKKTEISHPELEFRYCTCEECGPEGKAFCKEHLKEHKQRIAAKKSEE